MQSVPIWLDVATFRQDYLWFLVVAGWCALLAFHRGGGLPGLHILGAAAVINACSELAGMLLLKDWSSSPSFVAEAVFSVSGAAMPIGLAVAAARARMGPGIAVTLLLLASAALLWWVAARPAAPLPAAWGQTAVCLLCGAAAAAWARSAGRLWVAVCVAATASTFLGTSGIVAELMSWPRRWLVASPVGIFFVLTQLLVLGLAALACRAAALATRPNQQWLHQPRRIVWATVAWLLFGGALVEVAGWSAYRQFEHGLQARARTCLGTFDSVVLERVLGEEFHVDRIRAGSNPAWKTLIADLPSPLSPAFESQKVRLRALEGTNPDITYIRVLTIRTPWLVTAIAPTRQKWTSVQRKVTEEDSRRWSTKSGFSEGPRWSPFGTLFMVAEPIVGPGGRMLGWLTLRVGSSAILAAQAPARLLMCLTVGAGSAIAIGVFLLRARGQAHREAEAEAVAARAADRMKSTFLAHVSHELRTPLQGILGYAELLGSRPLSVTQTEWLFAQRRQGELLLRLVNDLIDLGALQSGVFTLANRSFPLRPLVEETVLSFRPRASLKHLTLQMELEPSTPPWVLGDPDRFRQILFNLIGNAIKFTEKGGVFVRLQCRLEEQNHVIVELAICDTGPGIAPADQARIFKPFARLERSHHVEGAGLGLALAHGFCRAMGGDIEIQSDGESGTTALVRLRLSIAPEPAVAATLAETTELLLKGIRIIVADDNALVRHLYLAQLNGQGAECVGVADGAAALEATVKNPPDILLLDLAMPKLDGLEVARQIRHRGQLQVRIIGISAHGNPEYRERALHAGMDEFMVKPVSLKQLSRVVSQHRGADLPIRETEVPAALLRRFLEVFSQETPVVLKEIEEALQSSEWQLLEQRAHYLKNSACVMGMAELIDCCEAVCETARLRDLATATVAVNALSEELASSGSGAQQISSR